jgi:hypothetical protein
MEMHVDYDSERIVLDGVEFQYHVFGNRIGDIETRFFGPIPVGVYELPETRRKYILFGPKITTIHRQVKYCFTVEGLNIQDVTLYPDGVKKLIEPQFKVWQQKQ